MRHPYRSDASVAVLILALFTQLPPVLAQKGIGTFTFPTERGLTFHEGDTIDVSYVSRIESPKLYLWCSRKKAGDNTQILVKTVTGAEAFNGTQAILVNFSVDNPVCHLNLRDSKNSVTGVNSVSFSLSSKARQKPKTWALQGSPTTSVASTATSPVPGSTTTLDSDGTQDGEDNGDGGSSSSSGGGLSTGAKAGIGVGVALGVLTIMGGLLLFIIRRRRQRRREDTAQSDGLPSGHVGDAKPNVSNFSPTPAEKGGETATEPAELEGRDRAQELESRETPQELPA